MSFDREMAKIMAGNGAKIIHGENIGNVDPYIEWIKWLSYIPEFEKKRIEYFDSKKISELTYEELEEASRYSRNKIFARLFKIYGTSECSEEDYMKVYDYMCSESIEKLMLSKLTSEELRYAKQEITKLSKVSKEQIRTKLNEEQKPEKYERLSMVDSYILHIISKINFARSLAELDSNIEAQLNANDIMRNKSYYYAANPQIKR